MLATVMSATVVGVDAVIVEVEAHLGRGLPAFNLVGLPDAAVQESKERVRAAIASSGLSFPMRRLTVNLAPGDIRKVGPVLDLPIALAVLAAAGELPVERLAGLVFIGEMGLDGSLRSTVGVLPVADMTRRRGLAGLVLPAADAPEASVVGGLRVMGSERLSQVVKWARGESRLTPPPSQRSGRLASGRPAAQIDVMSRIKGQRAGKRALQICAAGGHSLLLLGPPGAGKTMLASALPGLLPPLTKIEAIEVAKIQSVARLSDGVWTLPSERPFRTPHHTVSAAGLTGGGPGVPRPGEVSLAHRGVLFLDEFAEFRSSVLDTLRQPMQDGHVDILRATVRCRFPARFQLVAAANPCRCGFYGDGTRPCACTAAQVAAYRSKLSGPLVDRIDMHVRVGRPTRSELESQELGPDAPTLAASISLARTIRENDPPALDAMSRLTPKARSFMMRAFESLGISVRGAGKVADVARTICALGGETGPAGVEHVAEALAYRALDAQGQARDVS